MKSSIKFLAIFALFFTFSFAANAQRGGGKSIDPETMAKKQTEQMVKELDLDEAQTIKIQDINLAYAEKMQAAQEEYKSDRNAMKTINTAINTEKTAEIKEVLTDAQFKTYEEMQAKQGNKGNRKGGKGDRPKRS